MKTIFVVEQGEYSDYLRLKYHGRVTGVFSTRENAQKIADAINVSDNGYSEATVAEWPLDPGIEELNQGMHLYYVVMQKDGTIDRCERQNALNGYDLNGEIRMWHKTKSIAYKNDKNVQDVMTATVWASDDVHAVKIVNEHRTQFIADGRWEQDV